MCGNHRLGPEVRRWRYLKCFSTRRRPAGRGCWSWLVWRTPSSLWNHMREVRGALGVKGSRFLRLSHLKVCTSGTSLRLWPLILWTSLAAALIIFSTRFSCSCSCWVWWAERRWWTGPGNPAHLFVLRPPFTCFSACFRSRRKRSSSRTQAGSSLWPCCLACSSWAFSSRSTRSSCASRACRVRDTCRSSSRSRDVRRRPSRPLACTGGWRRREKGPG